MPRRPLSASARSPGPTPLYYRLESILRNAIDSGEYSIGVSLPPERELGELYGVSRITVRRAIETLVRDGLLRRVRGRNGGTFVLRKSRGRKRFVVGLLDRVAPAAQVNHVKVLVFDFRHCETEFASRLGVRHNEEIRYIERVISTPGGPIVHVRDFMPGPVGRRLERNDLDHALVKPMVKSLGLKIEKVQEDTEACLADSRIADLLSIRTGSPLLRVTRYFFTKKGRCLYLSVLLISSKYRISVTLPEESMN